MHSGKIFPFNFHGDRLYIVEHKGEPYVAMRHVVDGMGMDWKAQYRRLKQRFDTCVVEMTTQLPGDNQRRQISCLALRKLPGWLMTINSNKVKPEIRDKVIQYQQECDDALYNYWVKGVAINPRIKIQERMAALSRLYNVAHLISRERRPSLQKILQSELEELADVLNMPVPEVIPGYHLEPAIGDACLDGNAMYEFWDLFEMLENTQRPRLNHSKDKDKIAIDPLAFRDFCEKQKLTFPDLNELRDEVHLRSRYPLIGFETITSAITNEPVQCWVFRTE